MKNLSQHFVGAPAPPTVKKYKHTSSNLVWSNMFTGAEDFMGCSDCTEALSVCFPLNIYIKRWWSPSLLSQDKTGVVWRKLTQRCSEQLLFRPLLLSHCAVTPMCPTAIIHAASISVAVVRKTTGRPLNSILPSVFLLHSAPSPPAFPLLTVSCFCSMTGLESGGVTLKEPASEAEIESSAPVTLRCHIDGHPR